jgi:tetratricopeptide (TPR) repeat protein
MVIQSLNCAAAILIVLMLSMSGNSARADQKDPRLPELFERLKTATDSRSAQLTASDIWRIWSEKPDNQRLSRLLGKGIDQMNAGRLREAEKLFTTIIHASPDFAEAWNKRATVYFLMGAYDLSKQDIAQTIAREPKHFGALAGLGLVEAHTGNYNAALEAYEKAARIHPFLEGYDDMVGRLKKLAQGTPL